MRWPASITYRRSLLNPQQIAGTIPYMAPEQIQGKSLSASGQYALGVCTSGFVEFVIVRVDLQLVAQELISLRVFLARIEMI